jgi:dipeptidyl-peptidase 4
VTDSFPRLSARTQRFTLGAPRDITVSPDGTVVSYLRSLAGDDPTNLLWSMWVASGDEVVVVDPRILLADGDDDLPPEERARRERARESAGGIVAYAHDAAHRVATAALGGRLVVTDLLQGAARLLDVPGPVFDPRPDPGGRRVAWVRGPALWAVDVDDPGTARQVAGPGDGEDDVRWGSAEFIAAEEMGRQRGFWWAPDGDALLVARVDDAPVGTWWIADPASPAQAPTQVAYPAAGTADADVSAWLVPVDGAGDGEPIEVRWDRRALPYLARAGWDVHGPWIGVQSRDQRRVEVRAVDPRTGATELLAEDVDDTWVELVDGVPARLADGRLVTCADRDGARRLLVAGEPVTPADLQVRAVAHVGDDQVLLTANALDDATSLHLWRWGPGGLEQLSEGDGIHGGTAGGATVVLRTAGLDRDGTAVRVLGGPDIASAALPPPLRPEVTIRHLGERRLATALLLPRNAGPDDRLPVLLDPYGGPHAQRVLRARGAHLSSQWFADQGFAVVVVDGRGTPGRGPAWERAVHLDLAGPVLEDQVDALHALAEEEPRLDLTRVGIRGWSFGGYLAALAVLRRPDVFHAAVAGAPVTEWRLYDTHYTERYLGNPATDPAPYDRTSLLADAHRLERPLLLVHGLADDNVVAAHTLQLSSALLAAGRPHQVLPLTGVTHMASQEEVAENLLLLQLDFLRAALA